jgi:hypothetical protein
MLTTNSAFVHNNLPFLLDEIRTGGWVRLNLKTAVEFGKYFFNHG